MSAIFVLLTASPPWLWATSCTPSSSPNASSSLIRISARPPMSWRTAWITCRPTNSSSGGTTLPRSRARRRSDALRQFDIPVLGAIVNRVLPATADGEFLRKRREQEAVYLQAIEQDLRGLDCIHLPMLETDIGGLDQLDELADALAGTGLN